MRIELIIKLIFKMNAPFFISNFKCKTKIRIIKIIVNSGGYSIMLLYILPLSSSHIDLCTPQPGHGNLNHVFIGQGII